MELCCKEHRASKTCTYGSFVVCYMYRLFSMSRGKQDKREIVGQIFFSSKVKLISIPKLTWHDKTNTKGDLY
jgi:hypothetical protein